MGTPVNDAVTGNTGITGTITPGSSVIKMWRCPSDGFYYVRVRSTAWSTRTANVQIETATVLGLDRSSNTPYPSTAKIQKLELTPQPVDTFAATMTIDVTYSLHVISVSETTSATVTYTPSAAGTAGDVLIIVQEADSSGTVTATFASTFHSSGTQATTASHKSSITFVSDGTIWVEQSRTTAVS